MSCPVLSRRQIPHFSCPAPARVQGRRRPGQSTWTMKPRTCAARQLHLGVLAELEERCVRRKIVASP
eukprot:6720959-Prorocentrum_lima.AAC.1